jgi:hypothetical protein
MTTHDCTQKNLNMGRAETEDPHHPTVQPEKAMESGIAGKILPPRHDS